MNQLPQRAAPRIRYDAKAKFPPLPRQFHASAGSDAGLCRKIAEGLQLTRASAIALTRLQLALAGGDRRQTMAAIDRLHTLDGEMEHLVEGLPPPPESEAAGSGGGIPVNRTGPGDDLLVSLSEHLKDQKLALAFEKLALASGISGPDLVSADHPLAAEDDGRPAPRTSQPQRADQATGDDRGTVPAEGEPPLLDWHAFPDVQTVIWDRIPPKVWGIFLAVLVAAALVAVTVTMTMV